MSNDFEIHFKNVVERIFSNWTGLQMAVEHGMAGKQLVLQAVDFICNYCLATDGVQVGDIKEELEDMLEEEFNTVCEDNSPNDVAHELFKFLEIVKQGNVEMLITETNKLPTLKNWLVHQPIQAQQNLDSSEDDSTNDEADESMDVDPGWTVVKGKRKNK